MMEVQTTHLLSCKGALISSMDSSHYRIRSLGLMLPKRFGTHLHVRAQNKPLQQEEASNTSSSSSSAQSHLDVLETLTSNTSSTSSDGGSRKKTIGEQLSSRVEGIEGNEITVPLAQKTILSYDDLTIAQKRNIRRQKYLDQVAKRDDRPLFLAIALFVILPPALILLVAFATGFIQPLP